MELDCIRAMANSRSIIFTSSVLSRCSTVRLSSCIVRARLPTFGGRLICSVWSEPVMEGDAEPRVTLVTVVSVEGRWDCALGGLPSGGGDLESGADVGIEAVRGLQVVGESGRS